MKRAALVSIAAALAAAQSSVTTSSFFPVPTQDPNDTLPQCYPTPEVCNKDLPVVKYATTPNGDTRAPRGFNTWGMQDNPDATTHFKALNQGNVTAQCDVLASAEFKAAGFEYCSIDAGWNTNVQDEYGRTLYNSTLFNMPELADHLHSEGLKLGVYIIPGVPEASLDKYVEGTDILIGDLLNGNSGDGAGYFDFDYSKDGVQQFFDSQVALWASWGVDFIKLDFVTPGSPQNGALLVQNNTGAAAAYHKAIENSGKQIHLGLSWKLCRNETFWSSWATTADAMRTDQDINNGGTTNFTEWQTVQRAIENYRQFITLQVQRGGELTIHPDMDNLYVGNPAAQSGLIDIERTTTANHWIGAGANLITGSDLLSLDDLGKELFTGTASVDAANFCSVYPIQPRNPGTGCSSSQQLQAWIAGPNDQGQSYVLLANYGPDLGQGSFSGTATGNQTVTASLSDLGLTGSGYKFANIRDSSDSQTVSTGGSVSATLAEGESAFYWVTPN